MKRITGLLIIAALLAGIWTATAVTEIPSTLKRDIKIHKSTSNNPLIPGESPTTGLPTENSEYIPIFSQIDNNLGAIPQWGISQADIMYELPIAGQGLTRLTALFSDHYPEEAGPVRSGRVMHAELREEWDAALVFYGRQEVPGSNLTEILSKYGVKAKGLALDGHDRKYEKYMPRVRYHAAPHNVSAHIKELRDLLASTLNYSFPIRPFKFTDDRNYSGLQAQQFSIIHNGNKDTSSTFIYDAQANGYERFTILGAYSDYLNPFDSLIYSNVIIQRTKLTFNRSSVNPLLPEIVGSGAADIFIAGQYIAGAWSRDSMNQRTVFYDQNGEELKLQRGKTWIAVASEKTKVLIGDVSSSSQENLYSDVRVDENGQVLADNKTTAPVVQANSKNDDFAVNNSEVTNTNNLNTNNGDEASSKKNTASIKTSNKGPLNMRKKDSGKSDIIARIPYMTVVEVLEKGSEWTEIKYDNLIGYVMTKYLDFK